MACKTQSTGLTPIYHSGVIDIHISGLEPGKTYPRHIHYAEEQVIFCLDGECIHVTEGKTYHIHPREWVYIPPGAWHESYNPNKNEYYREIIISHIVNMINPADDADAQMPGEELSSKDFSAAVNYCINNYYKNLIVPFVILNEHAKPLYRSKQFSHYDERCEICYQVCSEPACISESLDFLRHESVDMESFFCPYGIEIFHRNILFQSKVWGAVRGQRISFRRGSGDSPIKDERSFEVIISQIAESLENYCRFDSTRKKLLSNQDVIAAFNEAQNKLFGDLRQSQEMIMHLKINNHFLFNAFNSMAALAIDSGNVRLYNSILALAEIIRGNSRNESSLISIREELHTVESYLYIQELRYGDKFSFKKEIADESLLDVKIPSKSLQTVVDNAFTHGFDNRGKAFSISIEIREEQNLLFFVVSNNGESISDAELNSVRSGIKNHNGHGLSLVYDALQQHFQNVIFDISNKDGQTKVIMAFSLEGDKYDTCNYSG